MNKSAFGRIVRGMHGFRATVSWVMVLFITGCGGGSSGSGGSSDTSFPAAAAPNLSLSADPAFVSPGAATTLNWSATDATSCTASNAWSGPKPTSGSESSGAILAESTFELKCTGPGGNASQAVIVLMNSPPPVPPPALSLVADPMSITTGDAATLTWAAQNADSCVASDAWSGEKATAGVASTGPLTSSSMFTLRCTGSDGSASRSVIVTVGAAAAPTISFTADPASVVSGGISTLNWSAANATSCTASGNWSGTKPTSGSQLTQPLSKTSSYTLKCTGAGGSVTQSASVSVTTSHPVAMAHFTRVTIEDGQAPWGKGIADIDGDGFPDIVEGGGALGGNIYWYQYPAWNKYLLGTVGGDDDLQVGDINGDGAVDVVVNGGIYWYENPRGSGGNTHDVWKVHTVDADNNAHDLVVGDINGDNKPDIVTRGEFGPTTLYLQNNPDAWTVIALPNAPDGEGTALSDINRDGRIDIVGNGYWLQQPNDATVGTDWIRHDFATWMEGSAVAVSDINQDGRVDIFLSPSERGPGQLAWFEAPANPVTGAWIRHDIGDAEDVHRFHLVDINKDGKLDLVFAEMHQSPNKRVGVYYNQGNGSSWTLQVLATTGSHNIAVGDIDNDGDIDIVGANWDTSSPDGGRLNFWRNELNQKLTLDSWSYLQVDSAREEYSFGINFGDMNSDGIPDIIAGRYWYRNPGGNMVGTWLRTDLGPGIDAMLVLDVDGGGRLDLIAEGVPSDGQVPVYWLKRENAAGTAWSSTTIGEIPADPADGRSQGYTLAQLTGDARPEIILSSVGIRYFQIPSAPTVGNWPEVTITDEAREEGIATADIDSDGDLDVVGFVAPEGTTAAWWENPGTGAGGWTRHDLGSTSGIEGDRIAITDINSDGKLDVIVTETNLTGSGNSLYWFAQPADPKSTNWPRRTIAADQGSLNSMDVGDINGDGMPDVITGEHRGSLKVVIWENVNDGTSWVAHEVSSGIESHLGVRLYDLDGDGDLDITSIAWDAYQYLHVWRNDSLQ